MSKDLFEDEDFNFDDAIDVSHLEDDYKDNYNKNSDHEV
jgi:hypothetical protein